MINKKYSICFVMMSLEGGGSERVMTTIMNNLDRKKYQVYLVLTKKTGPFLEFLHSDIEIIDLNCSKIRYIFLKFIKLLWLKRPDIVFSTIGTLNLYVIICSFFAPGKIKYVARESSIASVNNLEFRLPKLHNFLYRLLYPRVNRIICQSQVMKQDLIENFKISSDKILVNSNPLEIAEIREKSEDTCSEIDKYDYNLIAVGSLTEIKRFEAVISSLSFLPDKNIKLTILGKGILEKKLKQQVKELALESRVHFAGFQKNPFRFMKNADALIVTSRYEGYPNVVLEANICGIPAIAFNVPGGLKEIISAGINGLLVPDGDIKALAEAIQLAKNRDWDKKAMFEIIHEKYAKEIIISKYHELFDQLILAG